MKSFLLSMFALIFSTNVFAAKEIYTGFFGNDAVSGYDTVSFFDGTPTEGSSTFKTEHDGVTWKFANQANLDKFLANPAQYAPQYGGHCSWAIAANDALAPGDPMLWKVVDNKLYLNYNEETFETWNQDIEGFIETGDKNWAKR
ncbi:YHS domain-containing protein [Enterovibrio sp. ZSDZ42]|uniref:YHS domain-containing protein n=1 Tax=Enterovibrio gelatinilyticus TaxID=2899819 RepID=A0ABT5R593_9GAMM|nr:YHS domain-containing (seleno)protein [Enterovibrio sp. ZSDZ42]MDD1795436.1 YHS domain-containing protein [Enterovibrio sp. ZSDZ42]